MKGKLIPFTQEIIKRYENGEGSIKMASEFRCNNKTILKILRDNGIIIRKSSKSLVKENPFKDLNNEEVQYWLGYIMSDGNLYDKRITLFQTEKDKDIIYNYCDFLKLPYSYIKEKKNLNKNWDKLLYIRFGHLETFNFLKEIGITENKSHILDIQIPITAPMLRGLIEGDGSIFITNNKWNISFGTASLLLINKILNYLDNNDINLNIQTYKKFYSLSTSGQKAIKIIKLIYPENCILYNKRKYKKAQEAIKYYE